MYYANRFANVVMGGGGVKGIAYIGVFDVMERMGYKPANMAGVSAGSMAGAFAAAGYGAAGMWQVMNEFDFDMVQLDKVEKLVPAVARLQEYVNARNTGNEEVVNDFLSRKPMKKVFAQNDDFRGGILANIVTFCKEGCLFDGDLLEDWARSALARRGVRTFADLRGGIADHTNPGGYKVRMTGVDCNRAKVVVLPDDMAFYGINPDDFEVAKAVRISTCVPFAFKPVEIKVKANSRVNTYHLVDGGVLDSFPSWLVDCASTPTAGFKLNGGENKFFSLDTPLSVLKTLISAVHNVGVPKDPPDKISGIEEINTVNVKFLDFNLTDDDKRYMYNAGKQAALKLFNGLERRYIDNRRYIRPPFWFN
jgi:NTE family protein